jgi:hypothetical protein
MAMLSEAKLDANETPLYEDPYIGPRESSEIALEG